MATDENTPYAGTMLKAVIFDLGKVLSSPPSMMSTMAARIGTTETELARHYWTGRDAYDDGGSPQRYWAPILDATGDSGDVKLFSELATLDAELSVDIRADAQQLLKDCHASGITVAILSNAPHAMQRAIEDCTWRRYVDHVFVSASMGVMKPSPEIHAAVEATLGLEASKIAFVDDKQENIDGARVAGWEVHLWKDDADTRSWLVGLDVL